MSVKRFAVAGIVASAIALTAAARLEPIAAVRTTKPAREHYLARAIIWHTPPDLSPTDLLEGPAGVFPYTYGQATSDEGIPCAFERAGKELGGGSAKFLCKTTDGNTLRLKYWDPQLESGNREVFATVAASRLMWALGFNAIPVLPINVRCEGCPENPMRGTGPQETRKYVASLQAFWPTPSILSVNNLDQGWSWRELDAAIRSEPAGDIRRQQRIQFDALALLGVFIQHGDRKPEQQRLYCASGFDSTTGELVHLDRGTTMLLERPNTIACAASAVTILDAGATFGGAGHTSSSISATMDLREWEKRRVFKKTSDSQCRGDLTDSFRARSQGEPNPIISEEGRRFLLDQLHRLTREHLRAIFEAARVDQLDSHASQPEKGVNAWVSAFEDKVRQIDAQRCQPIREAFTHLH